jgi:hypothetical protein
VTVPDAADCPRRRAADHPPTRLRQIADRVAQFWERWGQLITGVWLISISTVLVIVAVSFYASQSDTTQAAKLACLRSQKFGPPFVDGLERNHIVPPKVIRFYRASIPTKCPR